jgi:inner membrane protein
MDTLTHIVLGGCIGEMFVGQKVGKRALFLGAVAQSVPDIDFIASFWYGPSANLLAHRGFTHSFLFLILATPVLAYLADRWRRPHDVRFSTWLWFFGVELLVHIVLDAFNAYGTGWFEPFNDARFSFHFLFVVDPLFSIVPGIVFVWLLLKRTHVQRVFWSVVTIGWCVFYLLVSLVNKTVVESDVKKIAQRQNIIYHRHFTTPTPFNNLLWFVVLESDKGYYIGHRSVFDRRYNMPLYYFPRNDSLLIPVKDMEDLVDLTKFSQGYYTVEKWGDTLVFNDLRFGQIIGWKDPDARFTFHYYLQGAYGNDMVVQRGRFRNWDWAAFRSMMQRIAGR